MEEIGVKEQIDTKMNTQFTPQFYKMTKSSVAFKATRSVILWMEVLETFSSFTAFNLLFRAGKTKHSKLRSGQLYSTMQELLQSGSC
jgi:hypothetical protein